MKFPVRPRSRKKLQAMATPGPVEGGQSEAVPWELFDVQTYVSAATTNLTFFGSSQTQFLGNITGQGLPAPQYYEWYYLTADYRIPPATVLTAAGPWTDYWSLMHGDAAGTAGTPTWRFELADKKLGKFPLRTLLSRGSINGFATSDGAAGNAAQFAVNGDGTGRGTFCLDGAIVIPPVQAFNIELSWPSAVTLNAGDSEVSLGMQGVLHRRVL